MTPLGQLSKMFDLVGSDRANEGRRQAVDLDGCVSVNTHLQSPARKRASRATQFLMLTWVASRCLVLAKPIPLA